jgi:transposase InsO family protein
VLLRGSLSGQRATRPTQHPRVEFVGEDEPQRNFYYLCSILDGCSRYIVNWDLRESMYAAIKELAQSDAAAAQVNTAEKVAVIPNFVIGSSASSSSINELLKQSAPRP